MGVDKVPACGIKDASVQEPFFSCKDQIDIMPQKKLA